MCIPVASMPSAVVSAYKELKKQTYWLQFGGIACMPCFCMGFICCFFKWNLLESFEVIKKIYAFYGGDAALASLSTKVLRENELFRMSTTRVNQTVPSDLIVCNVTLLQVICANEPRIGAILNDFPIGLYSDRKVKFNEYCKLVWDEYLRNGGNYHVVVYGLGEHVCGLYDPTSHVAQDYMNNIVSDTQLRQEVLLHKADALM